MIIRWTRESIEDRRSIFNQRLQKLGLDPADSMDLTIEDSVDRLRDFPRMAKPGRVPGTREFQVRKTPYILVYAATDEAIVILRVLNNRQSWPSQ